MFGWLRKNRGKIEAAKPQDIADAIEVRLGSQKTFSTEQQRYLFDQFSLIPPFDLETYAVLYLTDALTEESGRIAAKKINDRRLQAVSINSRSRRTEMRDGLTVVLPSDDDRISEVSFVVAGGCETCGVIKEADTKAKCECSKAVADPIRELGERALTDMQHEYVAGAAATFGTSISRSKYETVARMVPIDVLRELINDMKKSQTEAVTEIIESDAVQEAIQNIRKVKGA